MGYDTARWVASDNPADLKKFMALNRSTMGENRYGDPVLFAGSAWQLQRAEKNAPEIRFLATREMG